MFFLSFFFSYTFIFLYFVAFDIIWQKFKDSEWWQEPKVGGDGKFWASLRHISISFNPPPPQHISILSRCRPTVLWYIVLSPPPFPRRYYSSFCTPPNINSYLFRSPPPHTHTLFNGVALMLRMNKQNKNNNVDECFTPKFAETFPWGRLSLDAVQHQNPSFSKPNWKPWHQ